MRFNDLQIDDEFSYKGRDWKKKSQFSAVCLDKYSPYPPDAMIAFDRKTIIIERKLSPTDPNSIFRKRAK